MNHGTDAAQTIRMFIEGLPAPGGSKTAIALRRRDGSLVIKDGRPILNYVDSGVGNKRWKRRVREAAVFQLWQNYSKNWQPLAGPLELWAVFYMPRPLSHFVGGRPANALKPGAPAAPASKPDATKLLRSTEDALTGILWADDAQIVQQHVGKRYQLRGRPTGVHLAVRAWEPEGGVGLFGGAGGQDGR